MITTVKKYGSYILTKNTAFIEDLYDEDVTPPQSEEAAAVAPMRQSDTKAIKPYESSCVIPSKWTGLALLSVNKYNHDTSIFTFALPEGQRRLDLPVGAFMLILAPGCEHDGTDALRPYTSISDDDEEAGTFSILCKRYDQWGMKESPQTHFLFTKTDHSYRPPGAVSNYLHKLQSGDKVLFKHSASCLGRVSFPFASHIKSLTMIAVGVGIAPMIQILRQILKHRDDHCKHIEKIVVLYGLRKVCDILLREQLEAWETEYPDLLRVVFCVGSRYDQVTWGAKKQKEYVAPPLPKDYETLRHKELGWVNEEKIVKYGAAPALTTRVLVCGLPGVYDKLCGYRDIPFIPPHSALGKLGYKDEMVIKL